MPPFAGAICFTRNDNYDIPEDISNDQHIKPTKRQSKWNFIRCIRRKRKSRNKKLIEDNSPTQTTVQNEVESEPKYSENINEHKNNLPYLDTSAGEVCASDTSRLLYVENELPTNELSESIASEAIHKCVSCGEIKLCQKDLVEHLMRHVYEGLNAAVWLSTVMSTLVHNPVSSITSQSILNSQSANANL